MTEWGRVVVDTLPGLMREGANPAGAVAALREVARLELRGHDVRGALHRPQSAGAITALAMQLSGERRSVRTLAVGHFAYGRRDESRRRWGNVADPIDAAPYVWADSVGGDWQHDEVQLGALVGRSHGRLATGLALDYGIGQGARRNDPRPLFRRRVLEIAPGVAWALSARTRIGLSLRRAWTREDDEIGGSVANEYPVVFRLRGIGTFDRTQLISAERATLGGAWGGSVQGERVGDRWRAGAGVGLRVTADSVRDGVARPVSGGSIRRTRWDARASLRRSDARAGVDLVAETSAETGRGTDPVFAAINTDDQAWRGALQLTGWRGARLQPDRAVGAQLSLARLVRRDIAAETSWEVLAPAVSTRAEGRRAVGAAGTLVLGLMLGGATPLRSSYRADRPTLLTRPLARADFLVHDATVWRGGATVALERGSVPGRRTRVTLRSEVARGSSGGGEVARGRQLLAVSWEMY